MAQTIISNPSGTGLEPDGGGIGLQRRVVQALRMAVYTQDNPSADIGLLQKLSQAEAKLQQREAEEIARHQARTGTVPETADWGQFLGGTTTGLIVVMTLNLEPIPTGIYPFLDPEEFPLLTVT